MRGNHFEKFCWTKKRIVSAILSAALLLACIGFSTYAWLTSKDTPVVNEFVGSKLEIFLTPEADQGPFQLIPGVTYDLNDNQIPKITVEGGSQECYMFVVYEEINNKYYGSRVSTKGLYSWSSGLPGGAGHGLQKPEDGEVYVLIPKMSESLPLGVVESKAGNQTFEVVSQISINESVNKTQVHPDNFIPNGGTERIPTIRITAYAIQTLGFRNTTGSDDGDLLAAWNVVKQAIKDNNTKHVVLD